MEDTEWNGERMLNKRQKVYKPCRKWDYLAIASRILGLLPGDIARIILRLLIDSWLSERILVWSVVWKVFVEDKYLLQSLKNTTYRIRDVLNNGSSTDYCLYGIVRNLNVWRICIIESCETCKRIKKKKIKRLNML